MTHSAYRRYSAHAPAVEIIAQVSAYHIRRSVQSARPAVDFPGRLGCGFRFCWPIAVLPDATAPVAAACRRALATTGRLSAGRSYTRRISSSAWLIRPWTASSKSALSRFWRSPRMVLRIKLVVVQGAIATRFSAESRTRSRPSTPKLRYRSAQTRAVPRDPKTPRRKSV